MQFAINTPNFGSFGDARLLAELAHEAEDAGWDGFFVWDHIGGSPVQAMPMADPWIALTAMATSRIKLGPIVTPLHGRTDFGIARLTQIIELGRVPSRADTQDQSSLREMIERNRITGDFPGTATRKGNACKCLRQANERAWREREDETA